HYKELLVSLMGCFEKPLKDVEYLPSAERLELLSGFNATDVAYPRDSNLVDLFVSQALKTPDASALLFEDKVLSYKELDMLSNQLADYLLRHYEINSGDLIGVKLERSEWLLVCLLGILKSGGAYVPIDPRYPEDRIVYIESDSDCKITIDDILLGEFTEVLSDCSTALPVVDISATDLAYVMYTSGSTGKPKGVMVEHRNIIRLVCSNRFYEFSSSDVLLSTGAFSFDATTFEYWGPLLNGSQLVLCSHDSLLDSSLLSKEITSRGVSVMWFTSGWLNQLVDTDLGLFSGLSSVLVGGDKLSPTHIGKLRSSYPDLEIINGYGPTENTTFSLTYNIQEVSGDIPIGYPISNSEAYIVDDNLQLVPKGVVGELCLGGDGLSRGYLNREGLTREKFIDHPFKEGERLYRSGDLARWLSDGSIAFMGRKDDQVKIRGHRIELGEIEECLKSKEDILEAVVMVSEGKESIDKEVVAYLTSNTNQNTTKLIEFLSQKLPNYMLPHRFVQLENMPLTSNGKIDRRSLPSLRGIELFCEVKYVAPSNETERELISIWERFFNKENIGVNDNFFHIGGDSIKGVKILSEIQRKFNVKVNMATLFQDPTVKALAKEIMNQSWHNNKISAEKVIDKIVI
ncbi:non-ribosomal peptide synthetase, partial [Aquimarina litoralis]|uniref:non-ribosomal peptide synthetase n=1 Tax=Aquimarina litoralis TaxID=584605 RepID=UPI0031DC1690